MVSVQRVLIVLCAVLCHLMIASAQFDFGEFLANAEEAPTRDPRQNRGETRRVSRHTTRFGDERRSSGCFRIRIRTARRQQTTTTPELLQFLVKE
ncbi:Hypothetical protein CINCED_3A011888 [Cinara cedri]|uniref:Uncharacterized protein n=1 Tax=Cinara cedri TaxID=506608 RepID=A0A5E4MGH7_9HEMI|nr:Hypothetical protein CINCED_3A011888 [Cinara cedri]